VKGKPAAPELQPPAQPAANPAGGVRPIRTQGDQ
jgi:hypothetical protein